MDPQDIDSIIGMVAIMCGWLVPAIMDLWQDQRRYRRWLGSRTPAALAYLDFGRGVSDAR